MSIEFEEGFDTNNGTMETFLENPTCNGKSAVFSSNNNPGGSTINNNDNILNLILEEDKRITIFPNPSNSEVTITAHNDDIEQIVIYNLQGQIIRNIKIKGATTKLNVTDFDKGIYLFKVQNKIYTEKITVN